MNTKKKLRIKVLNMIVVVTFLLAIIFTFIDVKTSNFLLAISFVMAIFSYLLKLFWSQIKQFKQNGKQ